MYICTLTYELIFCIEKKLERFYKIYFSVLRDKEFDVRIFLPIRYIYIYMYIWTPNEMEIVLNQCSDIVLCA